MQASSSPSLFANCFSGCPLFLCLSMIAPAHLITIKQLLTPLAYGPFSFLIPALINTSIIVLFQLHGFPFLLCASGIRQVLRAGDRTNLPCQLTSSSASNLPSDLSPILFGTICIS